MKNKKGLTLIILLILTSIIIAIPNVINIFQNNKEKSFLTEVTNIKKEIFKRYTNNSLIGAGVNRVISSYGENALELDRKEIDYYAELNINGIIEEMYVSDGEFEYKYNSSTGEENITKSIFNSNNDLNKLDFMKEIQKNNKITVLENTSSIHSHNDIIPVIISNNTDQDISVNISYKDYILTNDYEIKANTDSYLIQVSIPSKVLYTLEQNKLYDLNVNITSPIKTSYLNTIKFKIVKQDVIISNVITSKGSRVAFTQTNIFSYNPINSEEIIVTLKNNSKKTYKITNINEYELNNNLFSQEIINLSVEYELDDIYIYPNEEKNIKFKYIINSNDNQHNINKIEILSDIYNNLDSLNITE